MQVNHIKSFLVAVFLISVVSCGPANDFDASGNFEADEVIVSAEQSGKLLSFPVAEGDRLKEGEAVGQVDVTIPKLQKEQTEAAIKSLREKTSDNDEQTTLIRKQLAVLESQLEQLQREKERTQNLVKADAATRKQLDDIISQIDQLKKQIAATQQQIKLSTSNTDDQNRAILSERGPLEKTALQFQEQVDRGKIINPINGLVLTKYALKGEMVVTGKPLYKIANIDTLFLKAYVSGEQLPRIKYGQQVEVRIDNGNKTYKTYPGIISWISNKSEFTPKTIQTKNERANLVYAIKVNVKNDGFLKIGMYGEMLLSPEKR